MQHIGHVFRPHMHLNVWRSQLWTLGTSLISKGGLVKFLIPTQNWIWFIWLWCGLLSSMKESEKNQQLSEKLFDSFTILRIRVKYIYQNQVFECLRTMGMSLRKLGRGLVKFLIPTQHPFGCVVECHVSWKNWRITNWFLNNYLTFSQRTMVKAYVKTRYLND